MDNSELGRKLREITNEFGRRSNLMKKNKNPDKPAIALRDEDIQESLNYLRICVKYQALDLEATRRERNYLRKLLEK